jgi:hypothetical protein
MRLILALSFTILNACADLNTHQASNRTGILSAKERQTLNEEAREAERVSHERYLATESPILQQKFRQEYPTMTNMDIDLLVNEALSKGLRQQPARGLDGPIRQPPMDCTSSPVGRPVSPNCY